MSAPWSKKTSFLLLPCGVAICLTWSRWAHAEGRATRAHEAVEVAAESARELSALRASRQRVAARERPRLDVIAMVNASLAEVGIQSDRLRELEPVADSILGGRAGSGPGEGLYRRQSFSLSLAGVSLLDVGKFLSEWRRSQPVWIPTRLELAHGRDPGGPAFQYDLRAVMTAIHLAESSTSREP